MSTILVIGIGVKTMVGFLWGVWCGPLLRVWRVGGIEAFEEGIQEWCWR